MVLRRRIPISPMNMLNIPTAIHPSEGTGVGSVGVVEVVVTSGTDVLLLPAAGSVPPLVSLSAPVPPNRSNVQAAGGVTKLTVQLSVPLGATVAAGEHVGTGDPGKPPALGMLQKAFCASAVP